MIPDLCESPFCTDQQATYEVWSDIYKRHTKRCMRCGEAYQRMGCDVKVIKKEK